MTANRRLQLVVVAGTVLLAPSYGQSNSEQAFADGVRRAQKVVLYEGLPHQRFESQLLEKERRTKAVQELNGFLFYKVALELKEGDAKHLTEVFGNPSQLGRIPDPRFQKACGGFHPDYAVEWHQGAKRFRALICFGCADARLYGPALSAAYDLDANVDKNLGSILKGYRKNRPARETRSTRERVIEDRAKSVEPAGER